MRLPRPEDVPATAGVSGLVLVLALMNYGETGMLYAEAVLFGAWGLMYVLESLLRAWRRHGRGRGEASDSLPTVRA